MASSTESTVQRVVDAVPALDPLLREHLDDMDGELLPHVFFGDVTRWAEDAARERPADAQRLLDVLEEAYVSGDDAVRELITVSFLENLTSGSPVACGLGPHLAHVLASL